MTQNQAAALRKRVKLFTWLFIVGLVLSGATAIPAGSELNWLVRMTGAEQTVASGAGVGVPAWATWLIKVRDALRETSQRHPFLFYGTDWLAFGHFVIAIAFIGALRDPVRNIWQFEFGLVACALVVPYALVMGGLRGIPFWWRMIDCSFGVFGAVPLWLCRRWTGQLADVRPQESA
jgi:hypothetical protein